MIADDFKHIGRALADLGNPSMETAKVPDDDRKRPDAGYFRGFVDISSADHDEWR